MRQKTCAINYILFRVVAAAAAAAVENNAKRTFVVCTERLTLRRVSLLHTDRGAGFRRASASASMKCMRNTVTGCFHMATPSIHQRYKYKLFVLSDKKLKVFSMIHWEINDGIFLAYLIGG